MSISISLSSQLQSLSLSPLPIQDSAPLSQQAYFSALFLAPTQLRVHSSFFLARLHVPPLANTLPVYACHRSCSYTWIIALCALDFFLVVVLLFWPESDFMCMNDSVPPPPHCLCSACAGLFAALCFKCQSCCAPFAPLCSTCRGPTVRVHWVRWPPLLH